MGSKLVSPVASEPVQNIDPKKRNSIVKHIATVLQHNSVSDASAGKLFTQFAADGERLWMSGGQVFDLPAGVAGVGAGADVARAFLWKLSSYALSASDSDGLVGSGRAHAGSTRGAL